MSEVSTSSLPDLELDMDKDAFDFKICLSMPSEECPIGQLYDLTPTGQYEQTLNNFDQIAEHGHIVMVRKVKGDPVQVLKVLGVVKSA